MRASSSFVFVQPNLTMCKETKGFYSSIRCAIFTLKNKPSVKEKSMSYQLILLTSSVVAEIIATKLNLFILYQISRKNQMSWVLPWYITGIWEMEFTSSHCGVFCIEVWHIVGNFSSPLWHDFSICHIWRQVCIVQDFCKGTHNV